MASLISLSQLVGPDLVFVIGHQRSGDKTTSYRCEYSFIFKVISSLLEREAPGLVHLILSSSLKRTPFAALSRPVAGTIKNTIIITLPGSVKAVRENLEALLADGVLAHALDLIRGGSGKDVHSQLSSSSELQQPPHHHHHHHNGHTHSIPRPRTDGPLSSDPSSNGDPHDFHGREKLISVSHSPCKTAGVTVSSGDRQRCSCRHSAGGSTIASKRTCSQQLLSC